jgi:hypothetical protein
MAGRGADHAQTAGEPDRQLATDTHRLSRSAAPTPGRDRERLDSVAQRRSRRAGLLRARDRAHTSTRRPSGARAPCGVARPVASRAPPPAVGQAAARACVAWQRRQHARRARTKPDAALQHPQVARAQPLGKSAPRSPGTPPAGFQLGLHRSLAHARDNTKIGSSHTTPEASRPLPRREGATRVGTNTTRLIPP